MALWQTIVAAIVGNALVLAILAWLTKSLIASILQRDIKKFEINLKAQVDLANQEAEHRFSIGTSSHMANMAFDKHVEFCEGYVKEVHKTMETLFKDGPAQSALPHAFSLAAVRRDHAVWLTASMEEQLQRFEQALRKIGANGWYIRSGGDNIENWPEVVATMYKTFADVLGEENMGPTWKGEALTPELATSSVIRGLRHILKVEELTKLREALINKALITIKNP